MKAEFVYVTVVYGFGAGKTLRAQVVREDGQIYYVCCPDGYAKVWYTDGYVQVRKGVK